MGLLSFASLQKQLKEESHGKLGLSHGLRLDKFKTTYDEASDHILSWPEMCVPQQQLGQGEHLSMP